MEKTYNILIVCSFVGLWITSMVPTEFEILFGFLLIFSFGILHGANDMLLINVIANKNAKHAFYKVLIIYLLTVFAAVILFYFIPLLALILFVIFSAYHFGEQHWDNKIFMFTKLTLMAYYFAYGLFVLILLFVFNSKEVIVVIESITNYKITEKIILYSFITTTILLILLSFYILYKSSVFKALIVKELFYLLVFAIIFKVSTLIWGFAIYFILWHSIPSLFEQIKFIYGNYNKANLISYIKKAFPYWLISLIGIAIVIFIFKEKKLLYAIIFSFIAAVTFPHAFVINKMFKHKKTQPN